MWQVLRWLLFWQIFKPVAIPIRLITYNIRYANEWPVQGEVKWQERRNYVISHLLFNTRYTPAAFISLQEAYLYQIEDIVEGLNSATPEQDWAFIGVGRDDGKDSGEFVPILYRKNTYSLVKFTNIWLSKTPHKPSKGWDALYWNRICTIGEFKHKASGKKLVVMNTHLDDQGVESRRKGAELIIDWANKLLHQGKYRGVLLTGDFNSEPTDDAYRTIQFGEDSPFTDVALKYDVGDIQRQGHQNTFTGFDWKPLKRIDYLFVGSKDLSPWSIEGYAVLETKYEDGIASSDHRPVVADLILK